VTSRPKKISDFRVQVQCGCAENPKHLSIGMRAIIWLTGSLYLAIATPLALLLKGNNASELSDAELKLQMHNRCIAGG
jgi:hypothetical protein